MQAIITCGLKWNEVIVLVGVTSILPRGGQHGLVYVVVVDLLIFDGRERG